MAVTSGLLHFNLSRFVNKIKTRTIRYLLIFIYFNIKGMFEMAQVLGKVLQAVAAATLRFWSQTSKITLKEKKFETDNALHFRIYLNNFVTYIWKKVKKRDLSTAESQYFESTTELFSNFVFFGENMRNKIYSNSGKLSKQIFRRISASLPLASCMAIKKLLIALFLFQNLDFSTSNICAITIDRCGYSMS